MTDNITPAVPAVHAAIVKVADELRKTGISKGRQCNVTNGPKFAFRGIEDVYAALAPLLAAEHLYIRPKAMQFLSNEIAGKQHLLRLLVTYTITCATDGSSVEAQVIGEGADSSDKGAGKAMSYAYKSLAFQLFCIPVVGQPDSDTEQVEPETPYINEGLAVRAREAAEKGVESFRAFWRSSSKADKEALDAAKMVPSLQTIATAADARAAIPEVDHV